MNRNYYFIVLSSIALLTVLFIQINWIWESARMKEELFNEKARMVLTRTAEALEADTKTFQSIEISAGDNEKKVIDSLFNHYLKLYNFHIDYYFEVKPAMLAQQTSIGGTTLDPVQVFNQTPDPASRNGDQYTACIGEAPGKSGVELKLIFPGKEKYLLAEMTTPFITSVVLILLVLILTWRTILSLQKEKVIAEHTTEFLNNMTHEFKTPLTTISLAGKMLMRDFSSMNHEKINHYSEIILEENEKLRQQIDRVLNMTALERGEVPLHKTEIDFHEMMDQLLKSFVIRVESRNGRLIFIKEADKFNITADDLHLKNAISNILDNALKYSDSEPELHIRTYNNADNLVLEITDNGIGIPKEYQHKVFDKYFRVPSGDVHDVKGFGIGLSYLKAIIELHRGTVSLESAPGKGSRFTIELPYA